MKKPNNPVKNRGVALIEVLAAVLLISFGLLGLVSLQGKAVQYSISAEDTQRASLLANEIAAEMWGANNVNIGAAIVATWAARIAQPQASGLPNGVGTVTVANNIARITITWQPPQSSTTNRYETDVNIQP